MKIKRRAISIITIIMIIFMGLIGRLAQIQLIQTESFSKHHVNLIEASIKQRTQSIVLDDGRGRFTDRNGEAITNDYYPSLVLFPFLKDMDWPSAKIAKITGIPEQYLLAEVNQAKAPFAYGGKHPIKLTEEQQKQINDLKIPGVFALYQQVYTNQIVARHLIGLVRQNKELIEKRYKEKLEIGLVSADTEIGIIGLERAFDEFLLPEGESKLLYHVDQLGGPLFGLEVKYTAPANPYYPTSIKTTLNKPLQVIAEQAIDNMGMKKGGLVLLDVETSDVLAIVSRPQMNEENPFADAGGVNEMIQPQIPGSVFKIVTAAAVLENDAKIRGRRFNCNLNLYGEARTDRELGSLNFEESFAQSCNYTFAKLAEELTVQNPTYMEDYAEKLGLISRVGWYGDVFHFNHFMQFPEERVGRVWGDEKDKNVKKAINQTAIGQKEVRVSPLAVANMMATIARGGQKKQVRAVSEVQYKNGTTLFAFPKQTLQGEGLSSYTSEQLQNLLKSVVQSGTGERFKTLPYTVAGKSGTAETGRNGLVNKWFAAYFPVEQPKYALVVVDLDVKESEAKTNDIVEIVIKKLYEWDTKK
ncbi:peptidoglycan D,D-transpeptidase FtsI family protein [Schinkia azotoformans]|uniref:peptidoglycan D,D-transpeptidase FtsI family protein n=1 Tax=Schinkia azotoformans TaxID=1454 RepID=UPI002DBD3509|nr:penicillin-binding protein 2 [Schinkia azotoformans]MEC1773720.1 penicillin-binding protein 2 [Schinkia azotoformans]MED4366185.1 penicillin-binding protein 2 [Schinkia azotoformans]